MIGSSLVRKDVDPALQEAIARFHAKGGKIEHVPMGRHGTCERAKGINFRKTTPEASSTVTEPTVTMEHDPEGEAF